METCHHYMFCIYVDYLLLKLIESGFGCYIGNTFVGSLGNADDIVLMSPSVNGMRQMLGICERYALENQIVFNGGTSKALLLYPKGKTLDNAFSFSLN